MRVTFTDFAAFVIAAAFVVAVFVAPYIMAWHYLDSHFSRMAEHDSRPLAEGSGLVLPGAPNAPSRPRIAVLHTGEKGGAMLHSSGQNRTLPSRTEVPSGECWSPVTQRGGLELGQKLCVTDRRDGRLEDCSLGQRATSSQLRPLDRTARTILRLPLVGSLQGEREKPETGNRSTGESASAVVQLPIRDNRRKHTEMRVPSRPELEHSLRVTKGSGLPDPASSLCWGRERGASAQAFEDVPPQFLSPLLAASHLCSVDAPLLASLVQRESEWKADAVSSAGAIGLGQLMPRTAKAMRIDPWVPEQNLIGAACHLRSMLDRYKGDERRALIAYHRGAWAKGPTPQASHDYAADIIQGSAREAGLYEALWSPAEMDPARKARIEEQAALGNYHEAGGAYEIEAEVTIYARDLIQPLRDGLALLNSEPSRFEGFNPENGWGDYAGLTRFVAEYLAACEAYPDSVVRVSR